MDFTAEVSVICSTAEKALRDLMQKAIAGGEYRHLPTLARMAEQINQLAARATQTTEPPPVTPESQRAAAPRAASVRSHRRHRQVNRSHSDKAVRSNRPGYPRFHREGDVLVKTGWSRKTDTEYQHRMARKVVDLIVEAAEKVGCEGRVFTVEQVYTTFSASGNTELPLHQVYLAVAWLRTEGLLQQHGRDGYSITVPSNLGVSVTERWNALTTTGIAREAR